MNSIQLVRSYLNNSQQAQQRKILARPIYEDEPGSHSIKFQLEINKQCGMQDLLFDVLFFNFSLPKFTDLYLEIKEGRISITDSENLIRELKSLPSDEAKQLLILLLKISSYNKMEETENTPASLDSKYRRTQERIDELQAALDVETLCPKKNT